MNEMGMQQCLGWNLQYFSIHILSVCLLHLSYVWSLTPVFDILTFKSDCLKNIMKTNVFKLDLGQMVD